MVLRFITIFFIFFATNISNSKPLPPGTGNSVPANILFLVDKSYETLSHISCVTDVQ